MGRAKVEGGRAKGVGGRGEIRGKGWKRAGNLKVACVFWLRIFGENNTSKDYYSWVLCNKSAVIKQR